MISRPTVIALYLPQYHPIAENDEWWGKGFTEWTNVTKALPLYRGHAQPNLPSDFGFYDLRVPETRAAQAAMASEYGVDAFCYYHYWFGNGRRLLERPFEDMLGSGKPDFPYMLCWANQTWSGVWHGLDDRILMEQVYPGLADERAHFECVLRAFKDPRYLRVEDKPVFMVYQPEDLPDSRSFSERWRQWAKDAGLPGLYLIAEHGNPFWDAAGAGFDAFTNKTPFKRRREWTPWDQPVQKIRNRYLDFLGRPSIFDYRSMIEFFVPSSASPLAIPVVLPNWDNTPRSGVRGVVLEGGTPEAFGDMLDKAFERCAGRNSPDRFLFVKSWNEWAEGNHLEPNRRYGTGYLQQLHSKLSSLDRNG